MFLRSMSCAALLTAISAPAAAAPIDQAAYLAGEIDGFCANVNDPGGGESLTAADDALAEAPTAFDGPFGSAAATARSSPGALAFEASNGAIAAVSYSETYTVAAAGAQTLLLDVSFVGSASDGIFLDVIASTDGLFSGSTAGIAGSDFSTRAALPSFIQQNDANFNIITGTGTGPVDYAAPFSFELDLSAGSVTFGLFVVAFAPDGSTADFLNTVLLTGAAALDASGAEIADAGVTTPLSGDVVALAAGNRARLDAAVPLPASGLLLAARALPLALRRR